MTLHNGREYLAIPGPSVLPDRVLRAMHRAAPNIYEGALHDMVPTITRDLKAVARTAHEVAMYIANGHGAWEAALNNTVSPGDHVLVLATGRFAPGWGEMAERLGAHVETIDFGITQQVDVDRVMARLADDREATIKAILVVQVDTSSSGRNDIEALGRALRASDHPTLLMVDCIACLACDRFEMDAWGVDVMVTGSQKGLMTPPGMGFVFFNERAQAARAKAKAVTHYWDWKPRIDPEGFYQFFDGTAPTHHLFGLREALDMIFEEGLEAVWRRHAVLAEAVWAAVDTWSEAGSFRANIADRRARSHAVTTVYVGAEKAQSLRKWCETRAGLTLGIGLGFDPTDHAFRIGHMGHVNAHMVLGALSVIEAGLDAIDMEHGSGALDAAAAVIARAA